jgi:tetratricopeptide (TPR) repeat protein
MMKLINWLFGTRGPAEPSESPSGPLAKARPDRGQATAMADVLAYGDVDATLRLVGQVLRDSRGALRVEQAEALQAGVARLLPDLEDSDDRRLGTALLMQGQCLEAIGHLGKAVAAYERARELDPELDIQARADHLRQTIRAGEAPE